MSSTTTRAGAAGALLAAALEAGTDAAADAALDGVGDVGTVEAGAALLDVPAVGVLAVDGDTTGVDVGVLACLELELHAAAKVASATRLAARIRDDVSTDLLYVARSTMRRP